MIIGCLVITLEVEKHCWVLSRWYVDVFRLQFLRFILLISFNIGHDTTAVSLAFAIAQMGRDKNIQKKAREEVLSVLGDDPEDVLPTKEDLKELKYLDAVIKEVCYRQCITHYQ